MRCELSVIGLLTLVLVGKIELQSLQEWRGRPRTAVRGVLATFNSLGTLLNNISRLDRSNGQVYPASQPVCSRIMCSRVHLCNHQWYPESNSARFSYSQPYQYCINTMYSDHPMFNSTNVPIHQPMVSTQFPSSGIPMSQTECMQPSVFFNFGSCSNSFTSYESAREPSTKKKKSRAIEIVDLKTMKAINLDKDHCSKSMPSKAECQDSKPTLSEVHSQKEEKLETLSSETSVVKPINVKLENCTTEDDVTNENILSQPSIIDQISSESVEASGEVDDLVKGNLTSDEALESVSKVVCYDSVTPSCLSIQGVCSNERELEVDNNSSESSAHVSPIDDFSNDNNNGDSALSDKSIFGPRGSSLLVTSAFPSTEYVNDKSLELKESEGVIGNQSSTHQCIESDGSTDSIGKSKENDALNGLKYDYKPGQWSPVNLDGEGSAGFMPIFSERSSIVKSTSRNSVPKRSSRDGRSVQHVKTNLRKPICLLKRKKSTWRIYLLQSQKLIKRLSKKIRNARIKSSASCMVENETKLSLNSGKSVDQRVRSMEKYFQYIQDLIEGRPFGIKNPGEMTMWLTYAKRDWVPRRDVAGPKTIDQIHRDMAREKQANALNTINTNTSRHEGSRNTSRNSNMMSNSSKRSFRNGSFTNGQNSGNSDDGNWSTVKMKSEAKNEAIDMDLMKNAHSNKMSNMEGIKLGPRHMWGKGSGSRCARGSQSSDLGVKNHNRFGSLSNDSESTRDTGSGSKSTSSKDIRVSGTDLEKELSLNKSKDGGDLLESEASSIFNTYIRNYNLEEAIISVQRRMHSNNIKNMVEYLIDKELDSSSGRRISLSLFIETLMKKKILPRFEMESYFVETIVNLFRPTYEPTLQTSELPMSYAIDFINSDNNNKVSFTLKILTIQCVTGLTIRWERTYLKRSGLFRTVIMECTRSAIKMPEKQLNVSDLDARLPLFSKLLNTDFDKQLQALFAIQKLVSELSFPPALFMIAQLNGTEKEFLSSSTQYLCLFLSELFYNSNFSVPHTTSTL
ncbi:EIF4G [Lepeophtheirus salmonis]|uniref:EIF4G n=1 Tax=Lepeophtheirus salmonis TaxID=72036 RepID=A0A7R8H2S5_LEPSM|nr:EIF4G [Lepeophtheirus salmonis]CAF2818383.1 EIF4G [Lepeophtheirus salmonis]